MMDEKCIAVLGRGKSLKNFRKFSHLFDTLYIVGTFHKEIRKIGIKHFKGKKIIHFVGRSDWGWRNNIDKKLNIIKIQTMYYLHQLQGKENKKDFFKRFKKFEIEFLPDYMKNRGYPLAPREAIVKYSKKYNNYKKLCIFLEVKFKKEIKNGIRDSRRSRYWPTTGIFALDCCLVENNPKKIYIFGIDCFKMRSYVKYEWEKANANELGRIRDSIGKLMPYHIEELVKEFPSTKFYSASSVIKLDYKNWNLI